MAEYDHDFSVDPLGKRPNVAPEQPEPGFVGDIRDANSAAIRVREFAVGVGVRVAALLPDLHEVTTAAHKLRTLANGLDDGPDVLPVLLACGEAEVAALRLVERVRAAAEEAGTVTGALYRLEQQQFRAATAGPGQVFVSTSAEPTVPAYYRDGRVFARPDGGEPLRCSRCGTPAGERSFSVDPDLVVLCEPSCGGETDV